MSGELSVELSGLARDLESAWQVLPCDEPRAIEARNIIRATKTTLENLAARPEPPSNPSGGEALTPEAAWRDLVEKDDRTSPADYPEMCLITFDELADYMASAVSTLPTPDVEALRAALIHASAQYHTTGDRIVISIDDAIRALLNQAEGRGR